MRAALFNGSLAVAVVIFIAVVTQAILELDVSPLRFILNHWELYTGMIVCLIVNLSTQPRPKW